MDKQVIIIIAILLLIVLIIIDAIIVRAIIKRDNAINKKLSLVNSDQTTGEPMIVFTFRQLYDGLKKNPSILDIDANKIRVVVDIKEFFNFIKKEKYTLNTKIGFTGGASTPKDQIKEYANLLEFFIYYKSKLKEFETELKKINKTFIEKDNPIVIDAINKFINMNGDGKFLRGCLIDLGYKLNKNDDYAKTLSLAYETFETSILIHDDIIDNAHLRRNKETIHETYKNEFKKYNVENDNTNNSLALCIGDLGFFYTTELITKKYKNDKNLANPGLEGLCFK